MSLKSGYFRTGLYVDLTDGHIENKELDESFLIKYIGGRGFGAKILWDNLKKHGFKLDPLGPNNALIIAPGPLTGTYIPSSGKSSFVSLSPATGIYGDSSMGGGFGVELRQAGIDFVSIVGKAPELSVLYIDNDKTRLIPMPELEGKSCLETEEMIREKLGRHIGHIATIGPAGENLVRFACVNSDWSRNAGRTGIGAVMGSKNLKAIAVHGNRDLPVYDLKRLIEESDKAYKYVREHKFFKLWQSQGLMNVVDYANETGILPVNNFRDSVFARCNEINGTVMTNRYKIGDSACFSCPLCCGNICLVQSGKYLGTVLEGPEYETCAMLGPNLGIDSFAAILAVSQLCDELGMDTISTGSIVGAVIEGYERGILSLSDLEGEAITWGDEDAILALIRKIARREGIGYILGGGSREIIKTWKGMGEIILQVKGLEQSAYDSRASITMALAYATSDIGAHHTRAWTIAKELEQGQDWSNDEKVDVVIYHQKLRPLFDMLGVCRLPWIEIGLNELHYEKFYNCVTGMERSLQELLELSNGIYDLTRLINVRMGVSRKDDSIPYKVWAVPPLSGPNEGKVVNKDEFQSLLSLYYQKRGWDDNGIPPRTLETRFNGDT